MHPSLSRKRYHWGKTIICIDQKKTMKHYGIERQALAVAMIPVLILAVLAESSFLYYRMGEQDQWLLDRANLVARQLSESCRFADFISNSNLLQQLADGAMWQKDIQSEALAKLPT